MEPALRVEGLRALLRLLVVALVHVPPADQHLAVLGQPDLHAREGRTDRADARVLPPVEVRGSGAFRHAIALVDGEADAEEELQDFARDRRRAAHSDPAPVQPDLVPDLREHQPVEQGPLGPQPERYPLPGLLQSRGLPPGLDRGESDLAPSLVGLLGQRGQDAGAQLLPQPGNAGERVGPDLRRHVEHLQDLGAEVDVRGLVDREVVRRKTLERMREGEI